MRRITNNLEKQEEGSREYGWEAWLGPRGQCTGKKRIVFELGSSYKCPVSLNNIYLVFFKGIFYGVLVLILIN